MDRVKKNLKPIRELILKINKLIVVTPIWLIIGLSGVFRIRDKNKGWGRSEKNNKLDKMY